MHLKTQMYYAQLYQIYEIDLIEIYIKNRIMTGYVR